MSAMVSCNYHFIRTWPGWKTIIVFTLDIRTGSTAVLKRCPGVYLYFIPPRVLVKVVYVFCAVNQSSRDPDIERKQNNDVDTRRSVETARTLLSGARPLVASSSSPARHGVKARPAGAVERPRVSEKCHIEVNRVNQTHGHESLGRPLVVRDRSVRYYKQTCMYIPCNIITYLFRPTTTTLLFVKKNVRNSTALIGWV